jgi:hypothetical protein
MFRSMAIDLADPNLAQNLLGDPTHQLAIEVFKTYIYQFDTAPHPEKLMSWVMPPLAPVEAIPGALQSIRYARLLVTDKRARATGVSADTAKAVAETLEYAIDLLIRGRSPRKPGRPPELKRIAVISFVLSQYTSLKWPEIADRLFVVNGACTRCKLPKHAYLAGSGETFQTPCVNVLLTEYNLLKRELTKQKIPLPQISSEPKR